MDELGPEAAKSYQGQQLVPLVPTEATPAGRARQEIDYGRRDVSGYVFGALQPATGEVWTATYTGRTTKNWVEFFEQVEAWLPPEIERIYAIMDNLNVHRSWDVLLFNLAHPRWEFVSILLCGGDEGDITLAADPGLLCFQMYPELTGCTC